MKGNRLSDIPIDRLTGAVFGCALQRGHNCTLRWRLAYFSVCAGIRPEWRDTVSFCQGIAMAVGFAGLSLTTLFHHNGKSWPYVLGEVLATMCYLPFFYWFWADCAKGSIPWLEVVVMLAVALMLFGNRLPSLMGPLGRAIGRLMPKRN